MNLSNFEKHIESRILSRGFDYFKSGCILSLECDGDEWVAEVEGSEIYSVTVELSESGKIIDTFCDCPYDFGEYCKHQAAVFYALRENESQPKSQPKKPKEKLEDTLAKLDKQTLVSLILHYAQIYKPIKTEIQFRYANKTDILESARQVIRSAINAVSHRGFVDYHSVRESIAGARTVLQMADDESGLGEQLTAIELIIVVLEEMMSLHENCDDSDGYVGDIISEAIGEINDIIIHAHDIKICDKACKTTAAEMRKEIAENYKKRPAFLDELRKIGLESAQVHDG